MGKTTGIPWTDATWNPWRGCHKVSTGCKNCYMFREVKFRGGNPDVVIRSKTTFDDPLKWRESKKIFTCSYSDFFIEEADEWRIEAWEIIRKTPQHTYQVLTKRPENIESRLPDDWGTGYPNVILMVTTENQDMLMERLPFLFDIPATRIGISCEPLLSPIRFYRFTPPTWRRLDWVIAGGESGNKTEVRKDKLDWYRLLRDQCIEAGVPFFLKQMWVGDRLVKMPELDGKVWAEMPA